MSCNGCANPIKANQECLRFFHLRFHDRCYNKLLALGPKGARMIFGIEETGEEESLRWQGQVSEPRLSQVSSYGTSSGPAAAGGQGL